MIRSVVYIDRNEKNRLIGDFFMFYLPRGLLFYTVGKSNHPTWRYVMRQIDWDDKIAGSFLGSSVLMKDVGHTAVEVPFMYAVCRALISGRGEVDVSRIISSLLDQDRLTPLCNMHDARPVFDNLLQRRAEGKSLVHSTRGMESLQDGYPALYCIPLSIFHALHGSNALNDVHAIVKLTHADERMVVATLWFGRLLVRLMQQSWAHLDHGKRIQELSEVIDLTRVSLNGIEEMVNIESSSRFGSTMKRIHDAVFLNRTSMTITKVASSLGREAVFSHTIPLAIAIALRNIHDGTAALMEVVASDAKNRELLAALTGALVGAAVGYKVLAKQVKTPAHMSSQLFGLGQEFFVHCSPHRSLHR